MDDQIYPGGFYKFVSSLEKNRPYSSILERKLFRLPAGRKLHKMPFGLSRYSFKGGDLDINMLARLWIMGQEDAPIQPLAQRMLRLLITDTRTVFDRIQAMKTIRAERRSENRP